MLPIMTDAVNSPTTYKFNYYIVIYLYGIQIMVAVGIFFDCLFFFFFQKLEKIYFQPPWGDNRMNIWSIGLQMECPAIHSVRWTKNPSVRKLRSFLWISSKWWWTTSTTEFKLKRIIQWFCHGIWKFYSYLQSYSVKMTHYHNISLFVVVVVFPINEDKILLVSYLKSYHKQ